MNMVRWMGAGAVVVLLAAAGVGASSGASNKTAAAPTTLTVEFEARPKLGYNRQGESTLSVISASGTSDRQAR